LEPGSIDIRFKHIGLSEDAVLRQARAPFTILTESDHVVVTLEADSWSEMEAFFPLPPFPFLSLVHFP
jgi:hypothetical protein